MHSPRFSGETKSRATFMQDWKSQQEDINKTSGPTILRILNANSNLSDKRGLEGKK